MTTPPLPADEIRLPELSDFLPSAGRWTTVIAAEFAQSYARAAILADRAARPEGAASAVADTLERYNVWRRGNLPGIPQPHPTEIGEAIDAAVSMLRARAAVDAEGWISVETLPEPGKAVLLDIGKKYPIRAMWVAAKTLDASGCGDEFGEYDEATDAHYWPQGWYEWNEHEETHWAVSATPLRWMSIPRPAAPGPASPTPAAAPVVQVASPAPHVGDVGEEASTDEWLLQDTRSYVGNDVVWWAKEAKGYTTDVSKAHVYSREDAFRQAAMRGCDRAWPKAYIDGKTRPAVDMQYINHDDAINAASAAQQGAEE